LITTEFILTTLIVVLIPGTGVLFTVTTGLMQGRRASIYAAIGCTLGILPHLVASILGLTAVLHTSALAYQGLKFAGALYLLHLAYATWKSNALLPVAQVHAPDRAPALMAKAVLLNLLNPKLTIFFLAFLPHFLEPGAADSLLQLLALSGMFMALTLVVFILYGLSANAFRQAVIESPRVRGILQKGIAVTFAGLGIRLAMPDEG